MINLSTKENTQERLKINLLCKKKNQCTSSFILKANHCKKQLCCTLIFESKTQVKIQLFLSTPPYCCAPRAPYSSTPQLRKLLVWSRTRCSPGSLNAPWLTVLSFIFNGSVIPPFLSWCQSSRNQSQSLTWLGMTIPKKGRWESSGGKGWCFFPFSEGTGVGEKEASPKLPGY